MTKSAKPVRTGRKLRSPKPEPDKSSHAKPAQERQRFLFDVRPWWRAFLDPRSSAHTWDLVRAAALTAVETPGVEVACFVCRAPFDDLSGPGGILTAVPISGDAAGVIALTCGRCWTGGWDDALRSAVTREFGIRFGGLQPVHPGGTA
jgi:hypothetical protein